jgi:hypothetical protein
MELNDFISEFYPEVLNSYKRYSNGWDVLKSGMKVKSLRAGFGGLGGELLKIIGHGESKIHGRYITLKGHIGNFILYEKDNWFNEIEVIGV